MSKKVKILIITILVFVVLFVVFYKDSSLFVAPFNKQTSKPSIPETVVTKPLTREEEAQKQSAGDKAFVEAFKQVEDKYPWYRQFPIVTADYTVVYDYEKESFRIRITGTYSKDLENIIVARIGEITKPTIVSYYVLQGN